MYASLPNWKYDKKLYHRIQSGPQRTGDNLNLTDTYIVVSSGFVTPGGDLQTSFGIDSEGADFGVITDGPPDRDGELSTAWRAVPSAVPGYWSDYVTFQSAVSGVLDVNDGYRRMGRLGTANANVATLAGPEPGLRDIGPYTWFGSSVPDNQQYAPFQTPAGNTPAEGSTGGPNSYPRARFPVLTNPTNDSSGSRAAWVYNPPVYCQTFTETVRTGQPGLMSTALRASYRGRSVRYVPNYGAVYSLDGAAGRNMRRTV